MRLAVAALAAAGAVQFVATEAAGAAGAPAVEGAEAPLAQLERVDSVRSGGVRFTRYRQELAGVPLLGAEAVVTDAPAAGDLLADTTRTVKPPSPARIGRGEALAVARGEVSSTPGRGRPRASLVALARSSTARLAWRVVVPSLRPLATWEVLVDARSAEVLRVRDLLRQATGSGRIFDMNPVQANGGIAGLPAATSDADDPDFDYKPVTLERLQQADCLSGEFVRARVGPPAVAAQACEPGWNFAAKTRADSEFEAVMSDFHIDRVQAYIRSLGFTNVRSERQDVFANSFPDDNAFYDTSSKQIELGTGGTDDGEDGDVIVHEYGHAIQDDQVPGFGSSAATAAMGEGFGDYLSAAVSNTFVPSPTYDPCLAEWDAFGFVPAEDCLRRADWNISRGQTSPDCGDPDDEHCAGEPWSSVLWAIRGRIGGSVADRLVIQSHFSLTPSASFDQASRALLAADAALYGGVHRQTLVSLLGGRGFVDAERLDDTPGEAVPLAVPGSSRGRLAISSDRHDFYRVSLAAGRPVKFRLGGGIADADLRLLAPEATSPDTPALAASENAGPNEALNFTPTRSGQYFLHVRAIAGDGSYEVEAAEDDADGDGVRDGADNCRTSANRDQRNWDGDALGDRCDPSSRITISKLRRRGRAVTLSGTLRPLDLAARAFRVSITQRQCRRGRCAFRAVREPRARRTARDGRVTLRFRLRPGSYRLRGVLKAASYRRAASRRVSLRVPRQAAPRRP
jgi:Bacterial pre-peptidase C-terminal domain/Fungalysin metallopeptidase (M36)